MADKHVSQEELAQACEITSVFRGTVPLFLISVLILWRGFLCPGFHQADAVEALP